MKIVWLGIASLFGIIFVSGIRAILLINDIRHVKVIRIIRNSGQYCKIRNALKQVLVYKNTLKMLNQKLKVNGLKISDTLIRRTQPVCGSESTIFILPKKQLEKIGMNKGDYVKVSICNGDSLLIQKVD